MTRASDRFGRRNVVLPRVKAGRGRQRVQLSAGSPDRPVPGVSMCPAYRGRRRRRHCTHSRLPPRRPPHGHGAPQSQTKFDLPQTNIVGVTAASGIIYSNGYTANSITVMSCLTHFAIIPCSFFGGPAAGRARGAGRGPRLTGWVKNKNY